MAELERILEPVKKAEKRLLECQRTLDSTGIAVISIQTRATLEKMDIIREEITEIKSKVNDRIDCGCHPHYSTKYPERHNNNHE